MPLKVDIDKQLGAFHLRMRFEADAGVLALLGASGSGKSMTLKCIAGIEKPDRGRIELNSRVLFDSDRRINLPPQQRRIGYLFQQYALFPHMTVRQNILCGLRGRKGDASLADAMIGRMRLTGLEERRPHQLSGGQQQRTALARILVSQPDLLLLDEPFSALDSHLRFQMEQEVRQVIRDFGKPVILVSHNRDEVFRLSDRIAVMNAGSVEAIGDYHAVFADPVTRGGAVLTGCKNISQARAEGSLLHAVDWGLRLTVPSVRDGAAWAGVRMHDIRPALDGETVNVVCCRVEEVVENPFSFTVMLRPEGTDAALPIGWEMSKEKWEAIRASRIRVCLPPDKILLLKD